MTAVCAGTKRDGSRCTATVEPPKRYCWWHDPANAERRRRAAAKGGRGATGSFAGEIRAIRGELAALYADVLSGEIDRGVAAVGAQIQNVRLRAAEVARKFKEVDELEERIVGLEERLRRYGA